MGRGVPEITKFAIPTPLGICVRTSEGYWQKRMYAPPVTTIDEVVRSYCINRCCILNRNNYKDEKRIQLAPPKIASPQSIPAPFTSSLLPVVTLHKYSHFPLFALGACYGKKQVPTASPVAPPPHPLMLCILNNTKAV